MRYRRSMKASILLYLLLVSSSLGAEVRKYEFVGETPAYQFSCGECSGPPYWVRAHVEGTFEVRLDYDQGVGTLLSLDARLKGAEGNYGPEIWQPIDWPQEFLGSDRYFDSYRPPFNGILKPAEYRPLGPGTLTAEQMAPYIGVPTSEIPESIAYWLFQGIGFEPAPPESWILSFDGALRSPNGSTTTIAASYNIYFEGKGSFFSYYVPIIDAVPSISAASATLVPEPIGLCMVCVALVCLLAGRPRLGLTRRCNLPDVETSTGTIPCSAWLREQLEGGHSHYASP